MKELPELETKTEWMLESEFPLLLASAPGAKFWIPDAACAEWLERVVDRPQGRGVST